MKEQLSKKKDRCFISFSSRFESRADRRVATHAVHSAPKLSDRGYVTGLHNGSFQA